MKSVRGPSHIFKFWDNLFSERIMYSFKVQKKLLIHVPTGNRWFSFQVILGEVFRVFRNSWSVQVFYFLSQFWSLAKKWLLSWRFTSSSWAPPPKLGVKLVKGFCIYRGSRVIPAAARGAPKS